MPDVTYTDEGVEYPELNQPPRAYVLQAEEERAGQEVTWPEIHERAWELQLADSAEVTTEA